MCVVQPLLFSDGDLWRFHERMHVQTRDSAHASTDSQPICSLAHNTHAHSQLISAHEFIACTLSGSHVCTFMILCTLSSTLHLPPALCLTRSFSSGQSKLDALPEAMPHMLSSSHRRQSVLGGAQPQLTSRHQDIQAPTQLWGHACHLIFRGLYGHTGTG